MATTGIYDGSTMRLFVDNGAGGAKVAIGYATTVSIDLSAETVQITHKDNSGGGVWADVTPKTLSGSISCEAYWAQTAIGTSTTLYWNLLGYFANRTKIAFAIKTAVTGDKQLVGYAYITNLSTEATDKQETTFSFSLETSGAVEQATIT